MRQYYIPGIGWVNETNSYQYQIAGTGAWINETASAPPAPTFNPSWAIGSNRLIAGGSYVS